MMLHFYTQQFIFQIYYWDNNRLRASVIQIQRLFQLSPAFFPSFAPEYADSEFSHLDVQIEQAMVHIKLETTENKK